MLALQGTEWIFAGSLPGDRRVLASMAGFARGEVMPPLPRSMKSRSGRFTGS